MHPTPGQGPRPEPTSSPISDAPATTGPRPRCLRCLRPSVRCLCKNGVQVANQTPVWILQHPRERRHPFGTVPLLQLALGRLEVVPCWQVQAEGRMAAQLVAWQRQWANRAAEGPQRPPVGLLFPSAAARPLTALAPNERPEALLVLDGTWATVRALFRQNAPLAELPHYHILPDRTDRYQIRREPAPHCTSTLEAVVAALWALEPARRPELTSLLMAMEAMVAQQLSLRAGRCAVRRRRRSRTPAPAACSDPAQ